MSVIFISISTCMCSCTSNSSHENENNLRIEIAKTTETSYYVLWNKIKHKAFPKVEPMGNYKPGKDYIAYPVPNYNNHKEGYYLTKGISYKIIFPDKSFILRESATKIEIKEEKNH